jgi:transcriptional regulator with XRE-family HTH domain
MNERERRQALADFLRRRRTRLSPDEVGLPPGLRRRTPGLRREEVALLANIGTSWYVWLEQGRDVHPSASVLESLAQALRLTRNERRHLFLLAGQPLPTLAFPSSEEHVSPALQQVISDLDPDPAFVIGRRWDYLAWNKAAECVLAIDQPAPPHSRNSIWRLFTNPTYKALYPNWEQLARGSLAELYTASTLYPGDAWFEELIGDLGEASPEFRLWWSHQDAPGSIEVHKVMKHPTLGHLEFDNIILQLPSDSGVKIMIHTPDAVTRIKLERLLEHVTSR